MAQAMGTSNLHNSRGPPAGNAVKYWIALKTRENPPHPGPLPRNGGEGTMQSEPRALPRADMRWPFRPEHICRLAFQVNTHSFSQPMGCGSLWEKVTRNAGDDAGIASFPLICRIIADGEWGNSRRAAGSDPVPCPKPFRNSQPRGFQQLVGPQQFCRMNRRDDQAV